MEGNVLSFMRFRLPSEISSLIEEGRFREAEFKLKELIRGSSGEFKRRLEFELDRIRRWSFQYPYSENDAYSRAAEVIEGLSREEFGRLIKEEGCVDYRLIEGEVRIFKRFLPNMRFLCPRLNERWTQGEDEKEKRAKMALNERAQEVMRGEARPLIMRVRAELSVKGVPQGSEVRAWLPVPRISSLHPRVKVLSHWGEPYISDERHPQRTAYFEFRSGETEKVWIEYEVEVQPRTPLKAAGELSDLDEPPSQEHTLERIPHITFHPELRSLVNSLTEGLDDPVDKARAIWNWVVDNLTYTYVHDYALFNDITLFAFKRRRGDCGIQAILLISMMRMAGIPARWQSGWYANPVRWGMHDWAQIYLEPLGWVYVDPSFGHPREGQAWRRDFYFGGIEGFRLAFNSEVNYPFDPPKEHFRSDPVDNQGGEAEWEGGNLYYDVLESKLEILEVRRS